MSDALMTGREAAVGGLEPHIANCNVPPLGLAAAAQKHFWVIQETLNRVATNSKIGTLMMGQLEPETRSSCFMAMRVLGIGGPDVRNTETIQSVLQDVLQLVGLSSLRMISVGSNFQLLGYRKPALPKKVHQTVNPGADQPAGRSKCKSTTDVPARAHDILAETTMLILYLGPGAICPGSYYQPNLWIALASKLAMLEHERQTLGLADCLSLGGVIARKVAGRAMYELCAWVTISRDRSLSSSGQSVQHVEDQTWDQLLPPLGPLQVLTTSAVKTTIGSLCMHLDPITPLCRSWFCCCQVLVQAWGLHGLWILHISQIWQP